MSILVLATVEESLAAGFGAVAALVLLGGSILLRWQRSRQQFLLMQAAIEKGTNILPGGLPFWLLSLRQGVMVLTLGVGLLVVGKAARRLAADVPEPVAAAVSSTSTSTTRSAPRGFAGGPPEGGPAFGPPERRFGPGQGGPGRLGGPGSPPAGGPGSFQPAGGPPDQLSGPDVHPPDPAMQRWHRAQVQDSVGLLAMACGLILVLLGVVRIVLARIERKFSH